MMIKKMSYGTDYYLLGIHRADRLMWGFFEQKNHRKSVIRLGEQDYGTGWAY
jgi:hypothetical protein